jgi:hypothetical protein
MANIPSPFRYNYITGSGRPFRQKFPVALGTTRTIAVGDICYMDTGDSDLVKVASATDNLHALVVADEAQVASDLERFIWCIVPRMGDVFEFDLDASTLVYFGLECQISDSQTLKISATDPVASVVDTVGIVPESGATQPTVTKVMVEFKKAGVAGTNTDLPVVGTHIGDAS